MTFEQIQVPESGEKISLKDDGSLDVPDTPIISFIEGDGAGPDIWKACQHVIDSAVERAYIGNKKIEWMEIFAGKKALEKYEGQDEIILPDETIEAMKEHLITLSGPLKKVVKPIDQNIHDKIIHTLDLYSNIRRIYWIDGIPAPIPNPRNVNMTIFCENTEDVFAGFDFDVSSPETEKIKSLLDELNLLSNVKFPDSMAFSIRPISKQGTFRIIRSAINYAIEHDKDSVTLVHKGNLLRNTEGSFMRWGYELAKAEFAAKDLGDSNWCSMKNPKTERTITIKDCYADEFLQDLLNRPVEFDVIVTMSLNGEYIADLLSAEIGATNLQPQADINFDTGCAVFRSNYGADHKFAGQNKVNPMSLLLSGEMMLRYLSWDKAADVMIQGLKTAINNKTVTYDLARHIENAKTISCSEFATEIVNNMP